MDTGSLHRSLLAVFAIALCLTLEKGQLQSVAKYKMPFSYRHVTPWRPCSRATSSFKSGSRTWR